MSSLLFVKIQGHVIDCECFFHFPFIEIHTFAKKLNSSTAQSLRINLNKLSTKKI